MTPWLIQLKSNVRGDAGSRFNPRSLHNSLIMTLNVMGSVAQPSLGKKAGPQEKGIPVFEHTPG
jgi:hypothetical protein